MKRILPILLTAVLLLTGCSSSTPAETQAPVAETTVPLETLGSGAVSVFPLQENEYTDLAFMGDKAVLLSGDKTLTVLDVNDGTTVAALEAEGKIQFDSPCFSASPTGLSYYLEGSREVIFLNPNLQVSNRIQLPAEVSGTPAVSLKNQEIYYCSGGEMRALHTDTGISRLVRTISCKDQQIKGSYFEGDLLHILVVDQQDVVKNQYVETKTGQILSEDEGIYTLKTSGNYYFAFRLDGMVSQEIFGERNGTPNGFSYKENLYPVPAMNGAVSAERTEQGLQLIYFDLNKQQRTAQVLLPQVNDPVQISGGAGHVWILAQNGQSRQQNLYKWDMDVSAVFDDTSCTEPLYTPENMDEEGMEITRKRAKGMASENGVVFYLAENAVSRHTELGLQQEYQVPTINTMLDEIEPVLSAFPSGFLDRTLRGGNINLCLVRSIRDGQNSISLFSDGDFWIFLTPTSDMRYDILMALGQVVDSYVLGNSRKYDNWQSLNPEGFQYYSDAPTETDMGEYLAGEGQIFADPESMTLPSLERTRLFYYAMTPAGEGMFQAPAMQEKLLTMCRAIREAYGYEKKSDVYPWEQYLTESIARIKK